ncbi:MAG TPA: LacI family DNA-binding transcriptional regulator [Roseiflexaceae bacterium]|nr:LacI family DNA-binding transcriptional regulator [Roseiflexaceae bacterium]
MRAKKRVTHVDVAKRAGVSTAVVSYVINDGPRPTSPEVRERVMRAIRELDYHPNAVARGLRARRTNTIGFVVDDYNALDVFVSPYSARILTGLTAQLKARGYYLMLYPLDIGEDMSDIELLLRSGRLDGIVVRLVQDPPESDGLLSVIAGTHVPCVCIERPGAPRFGFSAVTYDDTRGAYEATSYLIGQGHRRIGHIAGDLRYSTGRARLAGYQRALAEHGIAADQSLVYSDDWAPVVGRLGAAHLLGLAAPPTAIFAASDTFAFNAIEELRVHGRRVPEDMAVIGFDDIEESADHAPPLTTMRIPLMEIGRRAADLVLDVVESEHEDTAGRSEVLPVELVRRASA